MSKVLVFGDSIAKGLATYMKNNIDSTIRDAGVVGESISSGNKRAAQYSGYEVVIIATSTNNYNDSSIYNSYLNLARTLSNANKNATFYACASPGVSKNSSSYSHVSNTAIKEHNSEIDSVCRSLGMVYVDTYSILGDQGSTKSKYRSSDGLHLNSSGYALIASKIDLTGNIRVVNSTTSAVRWTWPVPGYGEAYITSRFGPRVSPTAGASSYHRGIDIGAPYNTPIVAASAGTVIQSGSASGYGHSIRIDHGGGIVTIYGHMYSHQLKVSKGDTVTAGEVIAAVGSDGVSTGNHLHFQVEKDGVAVDPLDYVDPNKDTYLAGTGLIEGPGTVDAGGTTVGQRTSGVTTQPVHPFVNIYIGETKLLSTKDGRPNIIRSFEYERLDHAGESAYFTLFDDNWEEIEAALSANFNNIYIEYGYPGTGMKSKRHKHLLQEYNLSFDFTGTTISVSTVTEGVFKNLRPRNIALQTKNPTEAVKKICKDLGFKVIDENFDDSKDIHADDPFNIIEDFPITYIYNTIIPQASQENEELFNFEIDDEGIAYFKRESYLNTRTDNLRTYIYQKGYDSTVIDFEVDIKAQFSGATDFAIATGYRSTVFDTRTKEQESNEMTVSSVVTEATGDITHTDSTQSIPVVDSSGYSASQMKNILYYNMKTALHDGYEATLTIVGDPTIDLTDRFVRVINMTDKGYLHHTSGVYWIRGITDTIKGGEMITALRLNKSATSGDIDGVEVINPKYIIK